MNRPSKFDFGSVVTPGGFRLDEVASAFQKAVRRSLVDDALFFGTELDLAGYGRYALKRLTIMASEDLSADRDLPGTLRALIESYEALRRKDDPNHCERLPFCHAIIRCAEAPKSRRVDHAVIVMYRGDRSGRFIPSYAIDKHTAAGRRAGRGFKHFFEQGAVLDPAPTIPDEYEAKAQAILRDDPKLFEEE